MAASGRDRSFDPAIGNFDPRWALRPQIWTAGEGQARGGPPVRLFLTFLWNRRQRPRWRRASKAASALPASSLRSAFGAARRDSGGGRGARLNCSSALHPRRAGRLGPGRRECFGAVSELAEVVSERRASRSVRVRAMVSVRERRCERHPSGADTIVSKLC
jgi:hypothetical protein